MQNFYGPAHIPFGCENVKTEKNANKVTLVEEKVHAIKLHARAKTENCWLINAPTKHNTHTHMYKASSQKPLKHYKTNIL